MEGESDPKAPLAENEEEEFGDPVPARVQATTALCGIVAGILLVMGLTSSEWVYAVDDFYYQGLFIYCAQGGFNETGEYSGEVEEDFKEGCNRIDLDTQGYTMFVALLAAVALSTIIFGTMLTLVGSWVQDIDSKRKVYRLALYLLIISCLTNFLSLLIYSVNFDDIIDEDTQLGPFEEPGDDWHFGWSYQICIFGLLFQVLTVLGVGYGLLLFPIIEEVVEDEEGAAAVGDK